MDLEVSEAGVEEICLSQCDYASGLIRNGCGNGKTEGADIGLSTR